jgi:hypothetical protein
MPGRPFKKGHAKLAGRKAGVPNKRTVRVKEAIEEVAARLGGPDGLLKWVHESPENETIFWSSMYVRLLPVQLHGTGKDGELVLQIKREELAQKLIEHGLPPTVLGIDLPKLQDLRIIESNGESNSESNGNARDD